MLALKPLRDAVRLKQDNAQKHGFQCGLPQGTVQIQLRQIIEIVSNSLV